MSACKVCEEPLLLEVEDDENEGQTQQVPDDLQLGCGCHFHWSCLMDQASDLAMSLKCPACQAQVATNPAGPSYTNEGGVQDNFDVLPSVTEEAYLAANPEARPARAFHVMCSEGDVGGIVELLQDLEQDETSMSAGKLIRYQDPLAANKTGLHLAVEKGQEEVLWLLLWLASPLATELFPEAALAVAQSMSLQRRSTSADDIRAFQDNQGRTAEAVAASLGGTLTKVVEARVLHPGT
ncbi:hypothetical protein PG993_001696 [Apiospora rasikravindrae]|uniref:RING-type domain-containing protein n=1 Tax=Apiospora rasikravindrae TaxID=990691 RepID=A0ABR1UC45_9PEZI